MSKAKKRIYHVLIVIGFIALGAVGMNRLVASKPEIKKKRPVVPAPLVRVMKVMKANHTIQIHGEGTVRPFKEIGLVPQVSGKVITLSPSMVNGGTFQRNELLARIDPADFKLAVTMAEARLKEAESQLQLTVEEAAASREEWFLHAMDGARDKEAPPPLVAKEPQLAASRAKLASAQADLGKAQLDLDRTELRAPFDGRVAEEDVDVGQYVTAGKPMATLYSTEAAEILVPMEDEHAFWFHIPGFTPSLQAGSKALVKTRVAGLERVWTGHVVRTEGKLDEQTRMINVVIRVDNPYASKPPLVAGLFVTVEIQGHIVDDAVSIPRSALHDNDIVWVVEKNNRLRFRKVDVAKIEGSKVVIKAGLEDKDKVVVTPLKAVTDGMTVRIVKAKGDRNA